VLAQAGDSASPKARIDPASSFFIVSLLSFVMPFARPWRPAVFREPVSRGSGPGTVKAKQPPAQGNRVKKCVTNGWGAESVVVL
jgi:hypothetical protein